MAAGDQAPPVLARRAPKADQIVITAGGARRKRAVGGIPVVAAEGEDGEEMARRSVPVPQLDGNRRYGESLRAQTFQPRPRGRERGL